MNKQLKFRAWDKQLKHFKYFDLATCLPCYADESNFVIQQWTGLFDKNQKEIYKGDIVKTTTRSTTGDLKDLVFVEWLEYEWVFCELNGKYLSVLHYPFYLADNVKIVGNIFENEDLLA